MGKTLMLQGTMSDSGKSFITAGICRYFSNKGYKVAPFKSQNMASNCYITEDGMQLGSAQALQAKAARCNIDARLNPILLKPKTNVGSEVIVLGKSQGIMSAKEYFKIRKTFFPVIKKAFDELSEENDLVIIEGAGSPAEINLKKDDIVNMGIAKMAKAPVLLIGDIDRGGVFASLYGTYELLEEDEKSYIKGFIINKFRGDKSLLMPGIDMFYNKLPVLTLGVMPYLDVVIDEEDSLSKKSLIRDKSSVSIAVIDFNGMKNFQDFLIFKEYEEVSLEYIKNPKDAMNSDLVIIPDFEINNYSMYPYKNELIDLIKCKPVISLGAGNIVSGIKSTHEETETKLSRPYKRTDIIKTCDNSFWSFLDCHSAEGFCYIENSPSTSAKGNILSSMLSGFFANRDITELILENILCKKGKHLKKYEKNCDLIDKNLDFLAESLGKNLDMVKIEEIIRKGI